MPEALMSKTRLLIALRRSQSLWKAGMSTDRCCRVNSRHLQGSQARQPSLLVLDVQPNLTLKSDTTLWLGLCMLQVRLTLLFLPKNAREAYKQVNKTGCL